MDTAERLLILSCSERKRPSPDLLPAIQRYDGPAFRVLRRFLSHKSDKAPPIDIFILSAAYGLIESEQPIENYDMHLSPARSRELRSGTQARLEKILGVHYSKLCIVAGSAYLSLLDSWEQFIQPGTEVTIAGGPQGVKLTQLKRWLNEDSDYQSFHGSRHTQFTGEARMHGVVLELSADEVFRQARQAIRTDTGDFARFRDWYVEVDGWRVSPKWLVSKLSEIPVSRFTSREARRVLSRLGVQVHRL